MSHSSSSKEPQDDEYVLSTLREAIILKLGELGAPKNACDHASCDYIILIAANKTKTKEEIAEELRFILNDKSEEFVDWYLPICTKLKTTKKEEKKRKRRKKSKRSRRRSSNESQSPPSLLTKLTHDLTKNYLPKPGTSSSTETVDELDKQIEAIIAGDQLTHASVKIEDAEKQNDVPVKTESSSSDEDEDDADTVSVTVAPQDTHLGSSSDDEQDDTTSNDTSSTDTNSHDDNAEKSIFTSDSDEDIDVEELDMDAMKPRYKRRLLQNISPEHSNDSTSISADSCTNSDIDSKQSEIVDTEDAQMSLDHESVDGKKQDGSNEKQMKEQELERYPKRHNSKSPPTKVKKRKLVSTVRSQSPESETPVRTVIPSVVAQPSRGKKCESPSGQPAWYENGSKILFKAIREANQSTVTAIGKAGTSYAQAARSREPVSSDDEERIQIELNNERGEELNEEQYDSDEGVDTRDDMEEIEPDDSQSLSASTSQSDDREYYYKSNSDLDYDSGPGPQSGHYVVNEEDPQSSQSSSLSSSSLSSSSVSSDESPTFIVTMNKRKEEYLPARQGVKRKRLSEKRGESDGDADADGEDDGDETIPQNRNRPEVNVHRKESNEEKEMKLEHKKFKQEYEFERFRTEYRSKRKKDSSTSDSNTSSEEEQVGYKKKDAKRVALSPKLSLSKLKLDSEEDSMDGTYTPTPPPPVPFNPEEPSSSGIQIEEFNNNNDEMVANYYCSMERWISDANFPASFDLPPPMPMPNQIPPMYPLNGPPPPMPPGFLPPPPTTYLPPPPPPMPPGFLPPPPLESAGTAAIDNDQNQATDSYEINVRVPCQTNDNLITVKCQKLDSPNTSTQMPCKFYPNCTKVNCPYLHTSICTTFPFCRFGKDCSFTHPTCKYGSLCKNHTCKYSHPTKTAATAHVKSVTKPTSSSSICKFHPTCYNSVCPFFHPKVCMYASNCKNAGCVFFHPNEILAATNNKTLTTGSFKWRANTTTTK